jgi:predicted methyltransferase
MNVFKYSTEKYNFWLGINNKIPYNTEEERKGYVTGDFIPNPNNHKQIKKWINKQELLEFHEILKDWFGEMLTSLIKLKKQYMNKQYMMNSRQKTLNIIKKKLNSTTSRWNYEHEKRYLSSRSKYFYGDRKQYSIG